MNKLVFYLIITLNRGVQISFFYIKSGFGDKKVATSSSRIK